MAGFPDSSICSSSSLVVDLPAVEETKYIIHEVVACNAVFSILLYSVNAMYVKLVAGSY